MPTFVFVRAEHVADLQRIRILPASPHPRFSIFRYLNRIPLIDDRDIASLRGEEERAKHAELKRIRRIVPVGSEVTVTEGAFAGMTGIVEQSNGKSALVSFGGSFTVSIAAWLLPDNRVEDGASIKDMAA